MRGRFLSRLLMIVGENAGLRHFHIHFTFQIRMLRPLIVLSVVFTIFEPAIFLFFLVIRGTEQPILTAFH